MLWSSQGFLARRLVACDLNLPTIWMVSQISLSPYKFPCLRYSVALMQNKLILSSFWASPFCVPWVSSVSTFSEKKNLASWFCFLLHSPFNVIFYIQWSIPECTAIRGMHFLYIHIQTVINFANFISQINSITLISPLKPGLFKKQFFLDYFSIISQVSASSIFSYSFFFSFYNHSDIPTKYLQ